MTNFPAATRTGHVYLWNTKSYKQVWSRDKDYYDDVIAVDFSPDSTRLLVASHCQAVSILDVATGEQVSTLSQGRWVNAVRYSPHGDRIALATRDSIRICNSNDSGDHLLVEIEPVETISSYNVGCLWSNDHLFVVSGNNIKQIETCTWSTVAEWTVPDTDDASCIALPQHGEFIACSSKRTITFWDTSTHSQLGCIQYPQDIHSIVLSPDDQVLAICGRDRNVTIKRLSCITELDILIDNTALESWKRGQLANAEALLTGILKPQNPSHRVLASRALVRAHMKQWDEAIADAKESIKVWPSIAGYIAKSVALVGKGEKKKGYQACDVAFAHSCSSHANFLLLVKAVIFFMAGECDDAISRVDDLIDTVSFNSICYMVQAYMYLLLGKSCMQTHDYEGAIRSFERARAQMLPHASKAPSVISLISGWNFDNLGITIERHLCETFYAAGHVNKASGLVLKTVDTFGEEVYMCATLTKWVTDFLQQCLAALWQDGDVGRNDKPPMHHSTHPFSLLREWVKVTLMMNDAWRDALTASIGFMAPRFMIYYAICKHLWTIDRIVDACECFIQMTEEIGREITMHDEQVKWALAFRRRCGAALEHLGDVAAGVQQHNLAITRYSAILSLKPLSSPHVFIKRSKEYMAKGLWEDALHDANQVINLDPSSPCGYMNVLNEWSKANLADGLWKGVLFATHDFRISKLYIYQMLCESLEAAEGIMDAIECFHHMASELREIEREEWVLAFKRRCQEKLARLGDDAMDGQRPEEALKYYLALLSIHPTDTPGFSIWRSKASMAKGLWEEAVNDANEAIRLDPSSPCGYETKYTALHGARRYDDAVQMFETMLSKMAESPDLTVRERVRQYVNPSGTRAIIRRTVQRAIRHSPPVLINTTTGRLHNKPEQEAAFMSLPIVNELISSMSTRIDRSRIKLEVRQFFRYVMFSHRWEENEPLFQQVVRMAVYDLDDSPTHDKLKKFCKMVQVAGFKWAWSDTCCINKEDHFVLQEALVAMFKWYCGAAMVFVFLRGVRSVGKIGDLIRSLWNTRAWTLQEYIAAKVIRFYTEDWMPYLNLDMFNHKESPDIIREMEEVTGVSGQLFTTLRPGLSNIREKLRLASTRQTTLVEDAAYSLLGIFSVAGMSPIYGEGENALGRLLANILSGSGDASILAWTGQSGGFNSCLPAQITVFNQSATSHLPPPIENVKLEKIISTLRTPSLDLDSALELYDQLNKLPAPWFAARRMKLPCIAFKLPPLSPYRTRSGRVYRAETAFFGMVEIKTRQDPSRSNSVYLIHPWLDALLDRDDAQTSASVEDDIAEERLSLDMENDMSDDEIQDNLTDSSLPGIDDEDVSDEEIKDNSRPLPERTSQPPPTRMDMVPMDRETRALRLIAHLRQPFRALLLSVTSARRRSVVYKQVAADSEINVQLRESVPLSDILKNVRILDVL